jgi:hypothetical protein
MAQLYNTRADSGKSDPIEGGPQNGGEFGPPHSWKSVVVFEKNFTETTIDFERRYPILCYIFTVRIAISILRRENNYRHPH